jgi:hypothetical protein
MPHPAGFEIPEHWLLVRKGSVVELTAHAVGVMTAFVFVRLKMLTVGIKLKRSRILKVREKLISSWLSRGVDRTPGASNGIVSVWPVARPGSTRAPGVHPMQPVGYLVVFVTLQETCSKPSFAGPALPG